MRQVSARDNYAQALAQGLTSKTVHRVPDPALTLRPATNEQAVAVLAEAGAPSQDVPIIGVAVRRWFHHRATLLPHKYAFRLGMSQVPGQELCEQFTTLLARVLDRLVERHGAYALLMPTYTVAHEADDLISVEVLRKMKSGRGGLARITDPRVYKAVCGRLAVMLGARMHPTIFSAAMGTPVVGLSYNRKFQGFFRLLDREAQVIPIEEFVRREMTGELEELLSSCIEGCEEAPHVDRLIEETRRFTAQVISAAMPKSHGRGEPALGRD
jgi:polysaccharide pyruvyl transferase WcaK-like protein